MRKSHLGIKYVVSVTQPDLTYVREPIVQKLQGPFLLWPLLPGHYQFIQTTENRENEICVGKQQTLPQTLEVLKALCKEKGSSDNAAKFLVFFFGNC